MLVILFILIIYWLLIFMIALYYFARVVVAKYHSLSGLNNRNLFSHFNFITSLKIPSLNTVTFCGTESRGLNTWTCQGKNNPAYNKYYEAGTVVISVDVT